MLNLPGPDTHTYVKFCEREFTFVLLYVSTFSEGEGNELWFTQSTTLFSPNYLEAIKDIIYFLRLQDWVIHYPLPIYSRTYSNRNIIISVRSLDEYLAKNENNKYWRCLLCGKETAQKNNATRHIKLMHCQNDMKQCYLCLKWLKNEIYLNNHMKQFHMKGLKAGTSTDLHNY